MTTTTLKFFLDATKLYKVKQSLIGGNGEVTCYRGTYNFEGLTKPGYGMDESNNCQDHIMAHILLQCRTTWPELYTDAMFDELFNVEAEVQNNVNNIVNDETFGTIVVSCNDNSFIVACV